MEAKRRTDIRIKWNRFFRKNGKKIIIGLIIWTIIIVINYILKYIDKDQLDIPSTTYTPHVTVLDNTESVPEKLEEPIENLVQTYFNYCNNGEYENAYNLLTDNCKSDVFAGNVDNFKQYVESIFQNKKRIYNIQSYSIVDKTYVYTIRILEDILATGTTDGYSYYEEKIVMLEENGALKLSVYNYAGAQNIDTIAEDDFMKVEIIKKTMYYETEVYTVKFTNKTDHIIVIADRTETPEIAIDLGEQTRNIINLTYGNIVIWPNEVKTKELEFTKFYDDGVQTKSVILNAVRVLNSYTGKNSTLQSELDNAVKLYSITIPIK